jgi:hypothetical protein
MTGLGAYAVVVTLSNIPGACSVAQGYGEPANTITLTLFVSSPTPVVAGSYEVSTAPPGGMATSSYVQYETTDERCSVTSRHPARAGSVVLTTVSSTAIEGTFNVTMDTGDQPSGPFVVPVCLVSPSADAGVTVCGS